FRFGDLIVRVDAVYVHFFMQKWGEERIFPHPNIYYRTFFCAIKRIETRFISSHPNKRLYNHIIKIINNKNIVYEKN
ncbi:hypothetical protein, partial [Acidaminococcus intestini]|uniref:hypothetical protein n=1 Tax=Acidaminococcus intestini TaxID=187327 RepID=UPI003AEF7CBC